MAALTPLDGGGIKTSRASLIGGIAVAIGVFVLWQALVRDLGMGDFASLVSGAAIGAATGWWIWRADL